MVMTGSRTDERPLGEINRGYLHRSLGKTIYKGIPEWDLKAKYWRAHEFYKRLSNVGHVHPEPLPPHEITGNTINKDLEYLEDTVAILFQFSRCAAVKKPGSIFDYPALLNSFTLEEAYINP